MGRGDNQSPELRVLGIDAGGTMTDTITIDRSGHFTIGKAQSTPQDESLGFMASLADGLEYWNLDPARAMPQIASGIYSGTAMLNRLLERKGSRVGVIVTAGQEDCLEMERGLQTWLSLSYAEKLHVVSHFHHAPLVPRERVHGVRGRVDWSGEEVIPLYEDEVEAAVRALLEAEVEAICVSLLFSWRNPAHERRVCEIAAEMVSAAGASTRLFPSSEYCPRRLDFPRLNTVVIEAYAAEPSRRQLEAVRASAHDLGAGFDLRVMASFGGTISIGAKQLVNTLISGPIGGVVGAKYLADLTGMKNVACSDIGGTSFDLALITDGEFELSQSPDIAHYRLNAPLIRIDSVGSGTGSHVRVNPLSKRVEIGPDSAGARIGVCYPEGGIDTVTITDCDVVLGLVNPDYFLGGEVDLDPERARRALSEQIAEPLGLSVEAAASGVVQLFEQDLQRELRALVLEKGYEPFDYSVLGYGGGGPLHVAGYTAGLGFADVIVPGWAAGFSAFGCACADFAYRFDRQVDLEIQPGAGPDDKRRAAAELAAVWRELAERIEAEFAKNGVDAKDVSLRRIARVQYMGQLNDVEVVAPDLEGEQLIDGVIEEFERLYSRLYAAAARSPELGYAVTLAVGVGSAPVEKPALPDEPSDGETPRSEASKGTRQVFWRDGWQETAIWDMERLRPGNRIAGPAILEAPSTTFVLPPTHFTVLDGRNLFHLHESEAR